MLSTGSVPDTLCIVLLMDLVYTADFKIID
jgi:hypothetical protein